MGHIIDIDGEGFYLHIENSCIIAKKEGVNMLSIHPSEVISIIVHGNQQSFSAAFVSICSDNNIPIIFCDKFHMPTTMALPFNAHFKSSERLEIQINASRPIKKQAWQSIVKAKLKKQADLLAYHQQMEDASKIYHLVELVKSGDSTFCEAQGARIYFQSLFGKDFRRGEGDIINILLDYTYTILRSCIAREVVGAGLNPVFSVFHSNKSNSFALIDDLMEPFRPLADQYVLLISQENTKNDLLTPQLKQKCISITKNTCKYRGQNIELQTMLQKYIHNYLSFINRENSVFEIPEYSYDITI